MAATIDSQVTSPETAEKKLQRRDWILLPAVAILTVSILSVLTEKVARRFFADYGMPMPCMDTSDPKAGVRGVPNSSCTQFSPYGRVIEYTFNHAGDRAGIEPTPKSPGAYRIVMLGSSYSFGAYVQRPESFATLLPEALSKQTGRNIELYNQGIFGGSPKNVVKRLDDAMAAQPDLILWPLTSWDMYDISMWDWPPLPPALPGFMGQTRYRIKQAMAARSIPGAVTSLTDTLRSALGSTRTHVMLLNLMYQSQSEYVKLYLSSPDEESGYLKAEPSPLWNDRLQRFDRYATEVIARANAAGVPLVVTFLPSRPELAMIPTGHWPQGYDPYALDHEVGSIITRRGGTFISMFPDLRALPHPENGYFVVDNHPNLRGHVMISGLLAKELTSGRIPALNVSSQTNSTSAQSR